MDDQGAILKIVARELEAHGDRVLATTSLREALTLAAGVEEVGLPLTDVVMPEMRGRDLATALRSIHPGASTLFMSGDRSGAIVTRGVLAEGVDFMRKPFSIAGGAARARELLDRGGAPAAVRWET